jgi:hypothetical protein
MNIKVREHRFKTDEPELFFNGIDGCPCSLRIGQNEICFIVSMEKSAKPVERTV